MRRVVAFEPRLLPALLAKLRSREYIVRCIVGFGLEGVLRRALRQEVLPALREALSRETTGAAREALETALRVRSRR